MTFDENTRREECCTRFDWDMRALMIVDALTAGLPILAFVWLAYASTQISLLFVPVVFALSWNATTVVNVIHRAYDAISGNAPATIRYARTNEFADET